MEAVIDVEGQPDYRDSDEGILGYENHSVGPYSALAMYVFDDKNELVGGAYSIRESYIVDHDRYLRDFRDLDARLAQLYGAPDFEEEQWISKPFEPSGAAIIAGDLILRSAWESEVGTILHQLSKPDPGGYIANHFIVYRTIDLGGLEQLLGSLDTGGL